MARKINTLTAVLIVAAVAGCTAAESAAVVEEVKEEVRMIDTTLPEGAIEEFFTNIAEGDFEAVYEEAVATNGQLNPKDAYVKKLEEVFTGIDPTKVQYATWENADGSFSYKVYNDGESIGTLFLRKNEDGNWTVSASFEGDENYKIEVPVGLKVLVNGMELSRDYLYQEDIVATNFSGMNDQSEAPHVNQYIVENLMAEPVVTVKGDSSYTTLKNVLNNTLYVGKKTNDSALAETMINDAMICAKWPAQEASLSQVAAISVTDSDWYKRVSGVQNQWFTAHGVSKFSNQTASNIIMQSEDTMVGYVTFDYYATNGDVERTWHGGYQMTFMNFGGVWKIAGMAVCNELNPALKGRFG
ncbi:MAG: hypothetical protein K6D03_01690 [Solobacterium sp.]|nr:hypothetical protein [Solobacterium sp.]